MTVLAHPIDFRLLPGTEASEPPEGRGLARDQVRLLVAADGEIHHRRFTDLGEFLRAGDLLVVNTSLTLAAAVTARRSYGRAAVAHLSTGLDDGSWLVELRPAFGATGPLGDIEVGERLSLPGDAALTTLEPVGGRLWRCRVDVDGEVIDYLWAHGRPIRYSYLQGSWPLSAYQTVFASDPGSAEMPSAGRPFSRSLVTSLVTHGVVIAPITLHCGVSSLDAGDPPLPERYRVPEVTAELVNATRRAGRRVVAVGTTVTRALESVAAPDGSVQSGAGWTDLVLGPARPTYAVDGIISGWHEPGASHLSLLEAVVGHQLVADAYDAALREGYLWHEFGDSCLLLPR
ncbi:MAG TPA: S-adenosylmethionine:tRNA ribosyltransferase-isomerase [Mycobacteriales bacterium]|nr:S-adenosylmethionine:tRNA ribosyltransferase-isomerase [Mycobacteriales bacterium]